MLSQQSNQLKRPLTEVGGDGGAVTGPGAGPGTSRFGQSQLKKQFIWGFPEIDAVTSVRIPNVDRCREATEQGRFQGSSGGPT